MPGDAIARRALGQIGTPFRLRGRCAGVALDCAGLVLVALGPLVDAAAKEIGYTMRGDYRDLLHDFFQPPAFRCLAAGEKQVDGDILLVSPGPSQLHLLIVAAGGCVHAHAGLRRVVHAPLAPEWQILDRWRAVGG
jgi:hypothetical protein